MRTTIIPITLLILALSGCKSSQVQHSCIQPPPDQVSINKGVYTEAAAKLAELNVDANLKFHYTNAVNTYFQKIGDQNAAYALFLNAIDCYMVKATKNKDLLPLVERTVPDLVKIIEAKWTGTQGGTLAMTDTKVALLRGSPVKSQIEMYRSREWFTKVANE